MDQADPLDQVGLDCLLVQVDPVGQDCHSDQVVLGSQDDHLGHVHILDRVQRSRQAGPEAVLKNNGILL